MHILLIIIVLCLIFPAFRDLLGGLLSILWWLLAAVIVLAVVGALSH